MFTKNHLKGREEVKEAFEDCRLWEDEDVNEIYGNLRNDVKKLEDFGMSFTFDVEVIVKLQAPK